MLSFASSLISGNLAKNKYPASAIIKEDYTQIDTSAILQNGGGVQIMDTEYRILLSAGLDTIGKNQLSAEEFKSFLIESNDKPYHYDILFQPEGEFWLIVTFPTSLRLDFSLVFNKDAAISDFSRVGLVLGSVMILYLLVLALFTFIYSRVAAARITVPLRKLNDGTRLLREGDYSARVDLRLKNEFAELQTTFNDMAAKIEHEINLRKKSESDRQKLILDISHDLKNPLSSIQGYTELCMKKQTLSKSEQSEYLKIIYQNSQRANLLLNELFELSQMDRPEFSMKTVKTDLCEYLRVECGKLVPQLERTGFGYEFDIPDKIVYAMLDVHRFSRIFQNLVDNALRYNPQGTTIYIRLTEENEQAHIHFRDDGCGIPDHLAEDIFKPFVRVDDSRNYKTGGSGLGLSIAKKIAEAHDGDLTLCRGMGKGSTFILAIPTIE
jgi:signal transduction histidine kinase